MDFLSKVAKSRVSYVTTKSVQQVSTRPSASLKKKTAKVVSQRSEKDGWQKPASKHSCPKRIAPTPASEKLGGNRFAALAQLTCSQRRILDAREELKFPSSSLRVSLLRGYFRANL